MRLSLTLLLVTAGCVPNCAYDEPPPPCTVTQIFPWFDGTTANDALVLNPASVYDEGEDAVMATLPRACDSDDRLVTVDGIPVQTMWTGDTHVVFAAPPRLMNDPLEEARVQLQCTYRDRECAGGPARIILQGRLTYDQSLEPQPRVKTPSPLGSEIPTDAALVVSFTRAVDPASVTRDTVFIEGVAGETVLSADHRTATFTPAAALEKDHEYRGIVRAGPGGVLSLRSHKELRVTTAPPTEPLAEDQDSWLFTTCAACP